MTTQENPLAEYLTIREAAESLGLTVGTIRLQLSRGKIRQLYPGLVVLIHTSEIERYRTQSLGKPGPRPKPNAPSLTKTTTQP